MTDDAYRGSAACGCVMAVAVDASDNRRAVARAVASWIRAGWTVERLPVATVRACAFRCPAHPLQPRERAEQVQLTEAP